MAPKTKSVAGVRWPVWIGGRLAQVRMSKKISSAQSLHTKYRERKYLKDLPAGWESIVDSTVDTAVQRDLDLASNYSSTHDAPARPSLRARLDLASKYSSTHDAPARPSLRARLLEFYRRHAPEKPASAVGTIAHVYAAEEAVLHAQLREKYGEDASEEAAMDWDGASHQNQTDGAGDNKRTNGTDPNSTLQNNTRLRDFFMELQGDPGY